MPLADFAVVYAATEEDDIFVQCFDEAELVVVSISRRVLDDYFGWPEPSRERRPSIQGCRLVVDRNLGALRPIIEGKYQRRDFEFLARAGSTLKHIILGANDLATVSPRLTDSVLDLSFQFQRG